MTHVGGVVLAVVRHRSTSSGSSAGNAVILCLVVVAVIAWIAYTAWRGRNKNRDLAPWRNAGSWSPAPPDPALLRRFTGHPFKFGQWYQAFNNTRNHHVATAMQGRHRDCYLAAFQYSYEEVHENNGKRRVTRHHYTIVSLDLPANRPTLEVTRHGPIAIQRDLQLESEAFNRAFLITTDNDKFAYDVLHPRTMEWLMADPRSKYFPFKFQGTTLSTWQDGTLDPARLGPMADYLVELRNRVPNFVWQG